MLTNAKIKIHPVGIYLLKVNNKIFRAKCVNCSNLTKKKKKPEQPHWYRDIKKRWRRSGFFNVNFEKIPHLFSAFHCWIWGVLTVWLYQHRSKYRQVKITKHARTGANHILTNRIKLQLEKKLVSNLKSMQNVGFEQAFTKFIEIFVL